MMSDQPHDVPHIQEQIRRLKIKRNELLVERVDIKTEIGKSPRDRNYSICKVPYSIRQRSDGCLGSLFCSTLYFNVYIIDNGA